MRRENWRLICTKRHLINLKDMELQITEIVTDFGGGNVNVERQSFSFDWLGRKDMTFGQRAELGRRLAKIEGLGCYVDVYVYIRKKTNKRAVSRKLFKAA